MLLLGFSGKKTVFNNVPLLDYKYDFGFGLFSEESLFSAMMKTGFCGCLFRLGSLFVSVCMCAIKVERKKCCDQKKITW